MKKICLVLMLHLVIACTSKDSVTIEVMGNDTDIVLLPSKAQDSIDVFVPYTFKISNNSVKQINSVDFDYKPNNSKFSEPEYLLSDGEVLQTDSYLKNRDISALSSKSFTIFYKTKESKFKIDKSYWGEDVFILKNRSKLRGTTFNRIGNDEKIYSDLRNKIKNDSIAFTFHFDDNVIIKVCKINEYKYKTITLEDVINNPDMETESIYKP